MEDGVDGGFVACEGTGQVFAEEVGEFTVAAFAFDGRGEGGEDAGELLAGFF